METAIDVQEYATCHGCKSTFQPFVCEDDGQVNRSFCHKCLKTADETDQRLFDARLVEEDEFLPEEVLIGIAQHVHGGQSLEDATENVKGIHFGGFGNCWHRIMAPVLGPNVNHSSRCTEWVEKQDISLWLPKARVG